MRPRSVHSLIPKTPAAAFLPVVLLLLIGGGAVAQKPTREMVRRVLTEGAGFTPENLSALEKGEIVVRELEADDEREVAFCGAIRLDAPRDAVFRAFRRAIERQKDQISEEHGMFRDPPLPEDMKKLSIESGELRKLRDCRVGDCSWSLSAELIGRFREEIDWSAADADEKAAELVRRYMAEHMAAYLREGDTALMEYNDDPEPLRLAEEYRDLLEGMLWVEDFAPEFARYLRRFPEGEPAGVEHLATWSEVKVAFKPVIINTHTIFYKKEDEGIPQGLIVSKQVYANHYFHSSMSVTGIVSFPEQDGEFSTYVLFVSRSRAGALTGAMGKLARVAVDGEAETKLTDVLKDTRRYTSYETIEEEPVENERGWFEWVGRNLYLILIALAGLGLVVFLWMTRQGGRER